MEPALPSYGWRGCINITKDDKSMYIFDEKRFRKEQFSVNNNTQLNISLSNYFENA